MIKEKSTITLGIKPTQVAAGALASVTAAVVGSNLGVAGTVAGAGVASVVSTVGATLYQHSIDRTRAKVMAKVDARTATATPGNADAETMKIAVATVSPVHDEPFTTKIRWPWAVGMTVAAFVLGMLVLTGVEWARGGAFSGGNEQSTIGALLNQPTQPAHQSNDPAVNTSLTPTSSPAAGSTTPATSPTAPTSTTSSAPTSTTSSQTTTSEPPPSATPAGPPSRAE